MDKMLRKVVNHTSVVEDRCINIELSVMHGNVDGKKKKSDQEAKKERRMEIVKNRPYMPMTEF